MVQSGSCFAESLTDALWVCGNEIIPREVGKYRRRASNRFVDLSGIYGVVGKPDSKRTKKRGQREGRNKHIIPNRSRGLKAELGELLQSRRTRRPLNLSSRFCESRHSQPLTLRS